MATKFPIEELDYVLPAELIAQAPPARREDARLLVVDRAADTIRDRCIVDLPDLLRPGDLLVLNDTKVLPAKFTARRKTGGAVPGLFVEEESFGRWRVLLEGSKRLRTGEILAIDSPGGPPVSMKLLTSHDGGEWSVQVSASGTVEEILNRVGQTPLPPYIRRGTHDWNADQLDRDRYQTVYAQRPGAV
ncbi:MAG: S-adenosylmethionine:tRNA ribosyltransferase-isomerase, partial [Planctomycetota bacterium]